MWRRVTYETDLTRISGDMWEVGESLSVRNSAPFTIGDTLSKRLRKYVLVTTRRRYLNRKVSVKR